MRFVVGAVRRVTDGHPAATRITIPRLGGPYAAGRDFQRSSEATVSEVRESKHRVLASKRVYTSD